MDTGINRMDKQSHNNGLKEHGNEAGSEGLDVERTLKTVASGFVGTKDSMADVSVKCLTFVIYLSLYSYMCARRSKSLLIHFMIIWIAFSYLVET